MKQIILLPIILCAFLVFIAFGCRKTTLYHEVIPEGDFIKLDISKMIDGKPVFYSFIYEGKIINFFVLKIDGSISSFFDACIRCYPKRLGYFPQEDKLICKACNVGYPISNLKGIGSCYPIILEGRTEGETYIIRKEKLIEGIRYF